MSETVVSSLMAARSRTGGHASELASRTPAEQVALYFREHSESVYRYLVCVYRNDSHAEEVTQEAFMRLYRALESGELIENAKAWVFTVARRLMLDRLKHERYETPKLCEMTSVIAEMVHDPTPSAEEVLIEEARRAELDAAMDTLTDLQKSCLHLRAEGLRLRQIGEVVHLDLRRVAEVIQGAVTILQRSLEL